MRLGLQPPLCGTYRNVYKDSCGAFIRSEIWACIAPGQPKLAARYAYEDAILDHGDGEGVYAEVMTATLESAAFVITDIHELLEIGLSYIPADCGVAKAARCAMACYKAGMTWRQAREEVLTHYRGGLDLSQVSAEDQAKGFAEGQRGWDVPSNIGMLVIGMLYGEGDFDKTLCVAVNCGEDTDCTGATAGSIFGLMHGAEAIPQRWVDPIGHKIKTACLNLGELGYFGGQLPTDLDDLTERTTRIAKQAVMHFRPAVEIAADKPTDLTGLDAKAFMAGDFATALFRNLGATVYRFPFFEVAVDYGDGPQIRNGQAKTLRLRITNTYKTQAVLAVQVYAPAGWTVTPSSGNVMSFPAWFGVPPAEVLFTVQADQVVAPLTRLAVELTSPGRPLAMLVPVTLVNGNLS